MKAQKFLEILEKERLTSYAHKMRIHAMQISDEKLKEIAETQVHRQAQVRVITEAIMFEMMKRGIEPHPVFEEVYKKTTVEEVN